MNVPLDLYGRNRTDRYLRFLSSFSDRCMSAVLKAQVRSGERRAASGFDDSHGSAPLELVVAAREQAAEDVVALRLSAPHGLSLPRWQPGAHLEVCLPSGLTRQYSLCGDPGDHSGYRIAVRRIADGAGSGEIHDALPEGALLTARGPRNAFPFAADRRVLFIAGGIGITPILPMAREAAARGLDWQVIHTGRSRASMPFGAELSELSGLAEPGSGRVEILPDDEFGVPDGTGLLARATAGTAVYCCGPEPMLDSVRRAFDASAATALHFERFTAAPIRDGRSFSLRLGRSGRVLPVPADRSVLDVLREWNPATAYSCRQGFCGVCTVHVTSGNVEHRDGRLSDLERGQGQMRVCVSRAPEGECLELDL